MNKIIGCILSGGLVFLYYIFLFSIILVSHNEMPINLFLFFIILFLVPIIGIVCVLFMRISEICSGEEEEAKKY